MLNAYFSASGLAIVSQGIKEQAGQETCCPLTGSRTSGNVLKPERQVLGLKTR